MFDAVILQESCSILAESTLANNLSFLIPYFLKQQLDARRKIVLVSTDNDLDHYVKIMKKLGAPLDQHLESRHLVVVDLLTEAGSVQDGERWSFEFVAKRINEEAQSKEETILFIDSLSTLISLTSTPQLLFSFVNFSLQFYSFIAHIHSDIHSEEASVLQSLFDVDVHPVPIDLISIANIDGALQIVQNKFPDKDFNSRIFYRLRETAITFLQNVDFVL